MAIYEILIAVGIIIAISTFIVLRMPDSNELAIKRAEQAMAEAERAQKIIERYEYLKNTIRETEKCTRIEGDEHKLAVWKREMEDIERIFLNRLKKGDH